MANEERLTTQEWKARFAANFDALVRITGFNRKEAAAAIGVSYRVVRRIITAGVSRTEDRNILALRRISEFFCLPSVDDLWRPDLLCTVLTGENSKTFIDKFRERLLEERQRRVADMSDERRAELVMMSRALGKDDVSPEPKLFGPEAEKVAAILASSKGSTFQAIIDDLYDLVRLRQNATTGG